MYKTRFHTGLHVPFVCHVDFIGSQESLQPADVGGDYGAALTVMAKEGVDEVRNVRGARLDYVTEEGERVKGEGKRV